MPSTSASSCRAIRRRSLRQSPLSWPGRLRTSWAGGVTRSPPRASTARQSLWALTWSSTALKTAWRTSSCGFKSSNGSSRDVPRRGNWKDAVGAGATAMLMRWCHVRCGNFRHGLRVDLYPANRGRYARVLLDPAAERPVPELQRRDAANAVARARSAHAVATRQLVHRLWMERNAAARTYVPAAGHVRQDPDAAALNVRDLQPLGCLDAIIGQPRRGGSTSASFH